MSQPNETRDGGSNDPLTGSSFTSRPAMVLVVEPEGAEREEVIKALTDPSLFCDAVSSIAEAIVALERDEYDAAIVPMTLEDGLGLDLVRLIESSDRHTKSVILADRPLVADAIDAMRSGAVDLLAVPIAEAELLSAVISAVEKARQDRRRTEKTTHLKSLCKKLHDAQRDIATNVDALSADLIDAYEEFTGNRPSETATAGVPLARDANTRMTPVA